MKNIKVFNWIELPFALLWVVALAISIYWTSNSFLFGLFLPPIISIFVAGGLIKWINPHYRGILLVFHTLALAGFILLIFSFFMYKTILVPMFNLIAPANPIEKNQVIETDTSQPPSQVKPTSITTPKTLEEVYDCVRCGASLYAVESNCNIKFMPIKDFDGRTLFFAYGNYTKGIPENKVSDYYVSVNTRGGSDTIWAKEIYKGWKPVEQRITNEICGNS